LAVPAEANAYTLNCFNAYQAPQILVTKNSSGKYEFKIHLRSGLFTFIGGSAFDPNLLNHTSGQGYQINGVFDTCTTSPTSSFLIQCSRGQALTPVVGDNDGVTYSSDIGGITLSTSLTTTTSVWGASDPERHVGLDIFESHWAWTIQGANIDLGPVTLPNPHSAEADCTTTP
jgi:hypothetical protein